MTKFLNAFIRDESGAAAAEYALILSIVGAGIAGAAFFLGGQISTAINGAGEIICSTEGNTCDGAGAAG